MFRAKFKNDEQFNVHFRNDSNFKADLENLIVVPEHAYNIGDGLIYDSGTNTISVDIVDDAIDGEHRPISSNGVYKEIGNIGVLLSTI